MRASPELADGRPGPTAPWPPAPCGAHPRPCSGNDRTEPLMNPLRKPVPREDRPADRPRAILSGLGSTQAPQVGPRFEREFPAQARRRCSNACAGRTGRPTCPWRLATSLASARATEVVNGQPQCHRDRHGIRDLRATAPVLFPTLHPYTFLTSIPPPARAGGLPPGPRPIPSGAPRIWLPCEHARRP